MVVLAEYWKYLTAMLGGGLLNYLTYVFFLRYVNISGAATIGVMCGSMMGLLANFWSSRWILVKNKNII